MDARRRPEIFSLRKHIIGARTDHISDAEHRQGTVRGPALGLDERVAEEASVNYE